MSTICFLNFGNDLFLSVVVFIFSHLAVMGFYESAPIEAFLLEKVKKSLHFSIQSLWILETYMKDLKTSHRNATNYLRAAKILLDLQKASFKHEVSDKSFHNSKRMLARATDYLEKIYGSGTKTSRNRYVCTAPPIVAFGLMASGLVCPRLAKTMRPLITMQTRQSDPFDLFHDQVSNKMRVSPILPTELSPCHSSTSSIFREGSTITQSQQTDSSGPSLEELSKGKAFSLKKYISKTAKNAKTLLTSQVIKSPPLPLTSNENIENSLSLVPPSTMFPQIPFYYHGDMQFINSLISVSERLETLNRSSRLKALHAELCLINHNLPAPICVHGWCNDNSGQHHRVLNILPHESSVLNSAERVPFVIFIEILKDCSVEKFNALLIENSHKTESEESHSIDGYLSESEFSSPTGLDECLEELSPDSLSKPKNNSNSIATASGMVDISERMRTAAVMLAQLARQSKVPGSDIVSVNSIRSRIIQEMESLEKDRLIDALQFSAPRKQSSDFYDDQVVKISNSHRPIILDSQDPSSAVFQEDWETRKERLSRASNFSHLQGWDVFSVIVKASTDMRQEFLAFQLMREFLKIFKTANLPIFLRPCKVLVTSADGGLIETVPNAISIHSIKKKILLDLDRSEFTPEDLSLKGYFIRKFGTPDSQSFLDAVDSFINSLAGYSLLTYTLQIRDRHNGNILLDKDGNLIHIDFGFMLSNSPGYVGFESAPFKLTADYLDLLEGMGSERWLRLKDLLTQGLLALRKHSDQLISLLEALLPNSTLPCFYAGEAALVNFKERLHLSLTDQQVDLLIDRLMTTSTLNVFTRLYDNYQYYTNGIL
jgi:phosphatidylinositol 4-kinase B